MASREFEPGRPGEAAVEVARIIERSLRDSRALDTESLVILSGLKVWHVKCDVHVLDHDGNLTDACCLAALAALTAFRRPEVTVGGATGKEITVHPKEVKEPVPLTIHHIPLAVTLALFEDGTYVAVDPNRKEESTMTGHVTCVLNKQEELCSIQKGGGVGIPVAMVEHCINVAAQKVAELTETLEQALKAHRAGMVQARVRRHAPGTVGADTRAALAAAVGVPTTGKGHWRAAAAAMQALEQATGTEGKDSPPFLSSESEEESEDEASEDRESEDEDEEEEMRAGKGSQEAAGGTSLPQGALLMPAIVKAAGLTGPAWDKAMQKGGIKPVEKAAKQPRRDADEQQGGSGGDDFADIAAVIACAAARAGAGGAEGGGLSSAIKSSQGKKQSRR